MAALISQIDGVGSLVGYERLSQKANTTENSVGASIPIISAKHAQGRNLNKQLRQEYDPLWQNSARLVETVANGSKGGNRLDYGQLRTVTGQLICMDQALFNNILKSPSIVNQIAQGAEPGAQSQGSKSVRKDKKDLVEIIREFLQSLPLGIVFILFTESEAFWFNIKKEYLQLQALDIPLKFPIQIGGTWHVTGIIDALPQDYVSFGEDLSNFEDKRILTQGFTVISQLITPLVGLFGRPADAYGLSPVVIHRLITM